MGIQPQRLRYPSGTLYPHGHFTIPFEFQRGIKIRALRALLLRDLEFWLGSEQEGHGGEPLPGYHFSSVSLSPMSLGVKGAISFWYRTALAEETKALRVSALTLSSTLSSLNRLNSSLVLSMLNHSIS